MLAPFRAFYGYDVRNAITMSLIHLQPLHAVSLKGQCHDKGQPTVILSNNHSIADDNQSQICRGYIKIR